MIEEEYTSIRARTLDETGLRPDTLPEACPWTAEQILDATFWPGGAAED